MPCVAGFNAKEYVRTNPFPGVSVPLVCGQLLPGRFLAYCPTCYGRDVSAHVPHHSEPFRALETLRTLLSPLVPSSSDPEALLGWLRRLQQLSKIPGFVEVLLLCAAETSVDGDKSGSADDRKDETLYASLSELLGGEDGVEARRDLVTSGVLAFIVHELAQACRVLPPDNLLQSFIQGDLSSCEIVAESARRTGRFDFELLPLTHGAYSAAPFPPGAAAAGSSAGMSSMMDPMGMAHLPGLPKMPPQFGGGMGAGFFPPPMLGADELPLFGYGGDLDDGSRVRFAVLRLPVPAPQPEFYFEVLIKNQGNEKMVAMGLHPSGHVKGMVGWEAGSFGFHADDGTFRAGASRNQPTSAFICGTGDVMGCGVDLREKVVYFTRNGVLACGFPAPTCPLFPVVTGADLAEVSLNLGQRPFAFTGQVSQDLLNSKGRLKRVTGASSALKKGVGYAEGSSTSVSDDYETRGAQDEVRVQAVLQVLCGALGPAPSSSAFGICGAQSVSALLENDECASALRASPLLTALSHLLQNDSLTEMAKSAATYIAICELVHLMLGSVHTRSLSLSLSEHFKRLGSVAQSYLLFSSATDNDGEGDDTPTPVATQLAKALLDTRSELVQTAESMMQEEAAAAAAAAASSACSGASAVGALATEEGARMSCSCGAAGVCPCCSRDGESTDGGSQRVGAKVEGAASGVDGDAAYERILGPHRIRPGSVLPHDFALAREIDGSPSREKLSRLAQEMVDATSALPCRPQNAIFMCVDSSRCDVARVLVTGVEGTPYASGCFVFDVLCPASYPSQPPKVQLRTTGNGAIRFNPNLYSNGKVCLSLLGTWQGKGGETWTSRSTMMQVFLSVQSLIMTDAVYFNEPGYAQCQDTVEGARFNRAYANIVRYGTVRHAMVDALRSPDPAFASIIRWHFFLRKEEILTQCDGWLRDARAETDSDVSYDGLVMSHNHGLASRFAGTRTGYLQALQEAVNDLRIELAKLERPPPLEDEDDE